MRVDKMSVRMDKMSVRIDEMLVRIDEMLVRIGKLPVDPRDSRVASQNEDKSGVRCLGDILGLGR